MSHAAELRGGARGRRDLAGPLAVRRGRAGGRAAARAAALILALALAAAAAAHEGHDAAEGAQGAEGAAAAPPSRHPAGWDDAAAANAADSDGADGVSRATGADRAEGEGAGWDAPRYEPPEPGSYALPSLGEVPEHTLLGADGAPTPLLALAPGEVAFVSFVYLSCTDACPSATASLQRLDRMAAADPRLAGRVKLVTVSFDPARDTPEAMARFREQLAHRGPWRFLTAAGSGQIAPVLRDFGQDVVPLLAADDPEALRHVLKVFLVDDARRVRNVYSTGFLEPRLLLNDALTVLGGGEREGRGESS